MEDVERLKILQLMFGKASKASNKYLVGRR